MSWDKQDELGEDMVIIKFLIHYHTIQFKKNVLYDIQGGLEKVKSIIYCKPFCCFPALDEPLICAQAHH